MPALPISVSGTFSGISCPLSGPKRKMDDAHRLMRELEYRPSSPRKSAYLPPMPDRYSSPDPRDQSRHRSRLARPSAALIEIFAVPFLDCEQNGPDSKEMFHLRLAHHRLALGFLPVTESFALPPEKRERSDASIPIRTIAQCNYDALSRLSVKNDLS